MRVMVIVKATRNSEAGVMPSENLLAAMGKHNGGACQDGRDVWRRTSVLWKRCLWLTIAEDPALRNDHLLPAVRGHLLLKVGRATDSILEFEKAAWMPGNSRERAQLQAHAVACIASGSAPPQ